MMPAAMSLEDVEIRHADKTILRVPRLSVEKGEVLTLVGPNGAGKSTLLQVLGLLQTPSQGHVIIGGERVTGSSDLVALRRRLSLIFQEPLLFRGTVLENVTLGLRLRKIPQNEIRERAELWLAKLNIEHLAKRSVVKLSVGEAQRVNLARSMVLNPEVFLLDEPLASLDPPSHASMVEELQEILRETKTTAVFATHNRAEAQSFGDRLAVMVDGQIVQIAPPEVVFSHPANRDVANLLGLGTVASGRVLYATHGTSNVAIADHQIIVYGTYTTGEELSLFFPPDEVSVLLPDSSGAIRSEVGFIEGTVTNVTPVESQFKIIVDCGFFVTVLLSKRSLVDLSLTKGKQVLLEFKPDAVHVMQNGKGQDS